MEIRYGLSWDADRGQRKEGAVPFTLIVRREWRTIKLSRMQGEALCVFSCTRGYIRWGDCTLEYFVIPNLVSYCVIGKADDGVFTSFYLVVNVMEGRDLLQHALSYVSIGGSFADVGCVSLVEGLRPALLECRLPLLCSICALR